MAKTPANTVRLHVRILQDVVAALKQTDPDFRNFSYADVKESFKARLARLKVPYDARAVAVALDRLEQGGRTSVFGDPSAVRRSTPEPSEPPLPKAEASRILQQLAGSVGTKGEWVSVGAIAAARSEKRRAS